MCDFCKKFGKGFKWYLNPENYSKETLKSERVQKDMMDCALPADSVKRFAPKAQ